MSILPEGRADLHIVNLSVLRLLVLLTNTEDAAIKLASYISQINDQDLINDAYHGIYSALAALAVKNEDKFTEAAKKVVGSVNL